MPNTIPIRYDPDEEVVNHNPNSGRQAETPEDDDTPAWAPASMCTCPARLGRRVVVFEPKAHHPVG
jgi:hypothetical protein